MKLKLDLHPIFSDGRGIEQSLQAIIAQAIDIRATEIEIIPGKGTGALKKSVIRFLDRPDIKLLYHRLEKDDENWGRLFVHFKHERGVDKKAAPQVILTAPARCFCCDADMRVRIDDETQERQLTVIQLCPACESPNEVTLRRNRCNEWRATSQPGY